MIRSDRGKENFVVGQMQIAYQVRQLGEQAWQAFRMGTSVHNQVVFFFFFLSNEYTNSDVNFC